MRKSRVKRLLLAAARSLGAEMWLEVAHDDLFAPLNEWVHRGNRADKVAFLDAYDALPPRAKAAWDVDVLDAFQRAHGAGPATMYRRMKDEAPGRMGGVSVTTDAPRQGAEVHGFEVRAADVLAHWAQDDSPLASRSFGHEREVVLRRDAKPRHLGVIRP